MKMGAAFDETIADRDRLAGSGVSCRWCRGQGVHMTWCAVLASGDGHSLLMEWPSPADRPDGGPTDGR